MLNNYEIIICGSATSTLSWALMSDTPLVFINYKNHASLKKDAYRYLKEAIFLFDYDSINFKKEIINFLNLNMDQIKCEWKLKREKRKFFINNFITNLDNKIDIYAEIYKKIIAFQSFNKKSILK